jgi:predicted DCC family thiol-disulfide oxidoreductase YuxK
LPRPLRDAVYALIARYRYRVFGRSDACTMPTPELKRRFVEGPSE